jgi:hypothetical protein
MGHKRVDETMLYVHFAELTCVRMPSQSCRRSGPRWNAERRRAICGGVQCIDALSRTRRTARRYPAAGCITSSLPVTLHRNDLAALLLRHEPETGDGLTRLCRVGRYQIILKAVPMQ